MSEVRLITPITTQNAKKMQVAAYCRVSSNSADQLNSYAAQIRAYKKLIGERNDWELVDIFADEGLTGVKSETRDEFQQMIRMCELKQIDLIVTKSVSRFARNTKDALAYVRKLGLLGVGIQFEKEGISTLSKCSRYALTDVLICGNCGTRYRRVTWSRNSAKRIVWRCISRLD